MPLLEGQGSENRGVPALALSDRQIFGKPPAWQAVRGVKS
jgi:hypothetical protein